ncbi:MAG: diacylglycerol kinase family lipid kinase [Acidobacteriota bacterium]|nr:MAG: diacylglycerol kinase family lipid kinase [Acidobacteriota bacterium]
MGSKRISLIYNPAAGMLVRSPDQLRNMLRALCERGIEVDPIATEYPGHATELARSAVSDGVDLLVVCGGDGTINEAVQPLVGSGTALAVWPCGTANVFSKEIGVPANPRSVAEMIAGGAKRRISVGRAVKPGTDWHRYFLLMAGIGLDATIVSSVDSRMKKWTGIGAYLLAGLDYLARLPQTPFTIEFNGQVYRSTFAVIGNASRYAVWFTLTPEARIDDDKLDICLFNTGSRIAYLNYALQSLAGRHTGSSGVIYQWTRQAQADSVSGALVQLDGEVVGRLPMSFEIVPQALDVVAPAGSREW